MSSVQPLVMVGTPGANTLDVIDAIEEINKSCLTYQVLGYINPSGPVEAFTDYPCLGGLEKAHDMATEVKFSGLIGNRVDTIRQMALPLDRYQTIIHPNAYVSPRSTVGRGCFIGAGCTVGATAVIGDLVVMLQGVVLSHDNEIGAYCTLTCGVTF